MLAAAGVASRRACEDLIEQGSVRVNGKVVSEQGTRIDPERDTVEVRRSSAETTTVAAATPGAATSFSRPGGKGTPSGPGVAAAASSSGVAAWQRVDVRQFQDTAQLHYFAVNKPKGYICSNADVAGKGKLAVELLRPWLDSWGRNNKDPKRLPPRFFTVGRLDVASSGLILITNDGQWAQKVIHPSAGVTKEYIVGLAKPPSREALEGLARGAEVEGVFVSPLEVEVLEEATRVRIVVEEGKKHEVRVLVATAGLELLSLKRVRIGGFRLPKDLGFGGYRELGPSEVRAVTDLRVQELQSVSPGTRERLRQAATVAQRERLPMHLRGLPQDVINKIRRAGGQE